MSKLKALLQNNNNYDAILSNAPYNLIIKHDYPYILFKYSQLNANYCLPEVREARGIIFREDTKEIVCYPFEKFGNYGEAYCPEIDWSSAIVEQKVDGSLIKFWYDDNNWHVSTNGTIDAYKAEIGNCPEIKSFGDLVDLAIKSAGVTREDFFKNLSADYTYMFELVSPYTKVVIPYENTELYFLGLRDCSTELECSVEDNHCNIPSVEFIKNYFKIPKRYPLTTLEETVQAANNLPWNKEGYVVCDKYFNRVKIKSPEYVKAHYVVTRGYVSDEKLAEVVQNNEIDEFLTYCPEYRARLNRLIASRNLIYGLFLRDLKDLEKMNLPTRKEFAELVNERYPQYERPYLFSGVDKLADKLQKLNPNKLVELIDNYLADERSNPIRPH